MISWRPEVWMTNPSAPNFSNGRFASSLFNSALSPSSTMGPRTFFESSTTGNRAPDISSTNRCNSCAARCSDGDAWAEMTIE